MGIGAAWGMLWIVGIGMFNKSLMHEELLDFLVLIFMIFAGITALITLKDVYVEYTSGDEVAKEMILSMYQGKGSWIVISQLAIILSPILFLWRRLRILNVLIGLVAFCYVTLPYHQRIYDFFIP